MPSTTATTTATTSTTTSNKSNSHKNKKGTRKMIVNATHTMHPQMAESVRLTTLCFVRLCVGYRSTLRPAGNHVSTTATDIFSASIVISATFLLVAITVILALFIVESMRASSVMTHLRATHTQNHTSVTAAPHIVSLFNALNTSCASHMEAGTLCTICLDDDTPHMSIRRLPCSHTFHTTCIDRWLLQRILTDVQATHTAHPTAPTARCPVCNTSVFAKLTPALKPAHAHAHHPHDDRDRNAHTGRSAALCPDVTIHMADVHIL